MTPMLEAAGGVLFPVMAIGFRSFQLAERLARPTPMITPMGVGVEQTGRPPIKAAMMTAAAGRSTAKPDSGWIIVGLVPTVVCLHISNIRCSQYARGGCEVDFEFMEALGRTATLPGDVVVEND